MSEPPEKEEAASWQEDGPLSERQIGNSHDITARAIQKSIGVPEATWSQWQRERQRLLAQYLKFRRSRDLDALRIHEAGMRNPTWRTV